MLNNIFQSVINFVVNYFNNLSPAEAVSMLIIISTSFCFIILERIIPYNGGQKIIREGFFNDLALYTVAQSYILSIIIFGYIIYFIDHSLELSRFKLFSDVPIWMQLIFFTITHDFYIYWMHRIQHKNKFLWRIHEAHHSPKKVDWLSGSRSHAFEILINQTVEFMPIVLLGSPAEVVAYKGVISAVWGMYIHSNIKLNTGRLQLFINGPEMHRWHHADKDDEAFNKNFSTKFAIWDWIFGTAYLPGRKFAKYYGLSDLNFPKNFIKQFFFAFRKFEN